MKRRLSLMAISLFMCLSVLAHHGNNAYDTSKPVVWKQVTVTKYLWSNPHVIILFDAKDTKGQIQHWTAEAGTPQTLVLSGWDKSSIRAGDIVTVYVYQSKTGNPVGRLNKIVLADGTELKDSALGYDKSP